MMSFVHGARFFLVANLSGDCIMEKNVNHFYYLKHKDETRQFEVTVISRDNLFNEFEW